VTTRSKLFEAGGFDWKGEFVIPKNPQVIAQRQKLHSLLFITGAGTRGSWRRRSTITCCVPAPGEAPPVPALIHDKNPGGWVTTNEWIRDAHGVWTDIRETDVLDGWKQGREEGDEKHVCPLQLEVIRRCVRLYTNPSELVLDPFMGIGSTAVRGARAGPPRGRVRVEGELPPARGAEHRARVATATQIDLTKPVGGGIPAGGHLATGFPTGVAGGDVRTCSP
jgi:hypothetical protein